MTSPAEYQASVKESSAERIREFFKSLHEREGMDSAVAEIVRQLWDSGDLNRDSLLESLQRDREKDEKSARPAD